MPEMLRTFSVFFRRSPEPYRLQCQQPPVRRCNPFKSFKTFNRFAPFNTFTQQSSFKPLKPFNHCVPVQSVQGLIEVTRADDEGGNA